MKGGRLRAPAKSTKEKDDDLLLFRQLFKRDNDKIASLLQPLVSTEFEAIGPALYKLPSGKKDLGHDYLVNEIDKNDSDWLKTPPATPLFPSLELEVNDPNLVFHKELPILQFLKPSKPAGDTMQIKNPKPGSQTKSPASTKSASTSLSNASSPRPISSTSTASSKSGSNKPGPQAQSKSEPNKPGPHARTALPDSHYKHSSKSKPETRCPLARNPMLCSKSEPNKPDPKARIPGGHQKKNVDQKSNGMRNMAAASKPANQKEDRGGSAMQRFANKASPNLTTSIESRSYSAMTRRPEPSIDKSRLQTCSPRPGWEEIKKGVDRPVVGREVAKAMNARRGAASNDIGRSIFEQPRSGASLGIKIQRHRDKIPV